MENKFEDKIFEDIKELKRISRGKLKEFFNQLFINNNSAVEILLGIRHDTDLIISNIKNNEATNPELSKKALEHANLIKRYIEAIVLQLRTHSYDATRIIRLCVGLKKEIYELENLKKQLFKKSFLEKIREKQGILSKALSIIGLSAALSTAEPKYSHTPEEPNLNRYSYVVNSEASNPSSMIARSIIETASKEIGKRYVFGTNEKTSKIPDHWDCSSLVRYAFSKNGINIEGSSRDLSRYGVTVVEKEMDFSKMKPGDLLFFTIKKSRPLGHVGIYVGDGKMLHAGVSTGVAIVSLDKKYWKKSFEKAKRLF
ncbi:MAG: C40 family peptidase [Candidatus Woesearchaeota archaeon]